MVLYYLQISGMNMIEQKPITKCYIWMGGGSLWNLEFFYNQ